MSSFGIGPTGFRPMTLGDARSDLQAALRQSFGDNINLDSRSVFGNLVDIFAERFASLWQLSQAVYGSSDVGSASGLAVDNILALNNLTRIQAAPTKTAPAPVTQTNGVTLYGLVLTGDPGTVVPKGALISDGLAAPTTFSLDADVTIQPSTNARQTLTFSNAPDAGSYTLTLTDAEGQATTSGALSYGQSASSLQATLQGLGRADGKLPFSDLVVSTLGTGYQFDFGAGQVAANQPSCAAAAIALIEVSANSLSAAGVATNIVILEPRVGAPAQGIGSATATSTGANAELAGALTTIVTPQSGWSTVTNQLDCITGSAVESDADALARMASLRSSQGSASLSAIVERVKQVSGVTAVIGFENKTSAALQVLTFSGAPTNGSLAIETAFGRTGTLTAPITAATVQTALSSLPHLTEVLVTGAPATGLNIDFNGAGGGQPQPLVSVVNNTTQTTTTVTFGRPSHSVELVVDGGSVTDVATAILAALPAGISAWGTPALQTLGSIQTGSSSLSVAYAVGASPGQIVTMASLPLGTLVASVSQQSILVNQVGQSTVSNAPLQLQTGALLTDIQSNARLITFTRPQKLQIYVSIALVTDARTQPGNANSAANASAKWSAASVASIQQAVADSINATPIGGTIVARGTSGVANAFRSVQGIFDATVKFDTVNPPINSDNLPLQAAQSAVCEVANVSVSFV